MGVTTTDPKDPDLTRGGDTEKTPLAKKYLVLSEEERAKGFVAPVRRSYSHMVCGAVTTMAKEIAETYARDPSFYGYTYCCHCEKHLLVGEFKWVDDDQIVGSEYKAPESPYQNTDITEDAMRYLGLPRYGDTDSIFQGNLVWYEQCKALYGEDWEKKIDFLNSKWDDHCNSFNP